MWRKTVLTGFVVFCLILTSLPIASSVHETNSSIRSSDQNSSFFSTPEYDQTISEMIDKVNSTRIEEYITKLQNFETRYIETEGNEKATEWIKNKFRSFGLDSDLQNFTYEGEELSNVIATQKGVNPDKESSTIVIGAHFDSISGATYNNSSTPAPGADDDASGVAATLETARIMSNYNYSRTIKYCAWNAEEVGLEGSDYFTNTVVRDDETKIDAMFQYDMIGYNGNESNKIKIHANQDSNPQLDHTLEVNQTYETQVNINPIYNSTMEASDHSPFWYSGYNATMTIEENMNPYYHTGEDTIDKISMSMVKSVTELSVACTAHLGELVKPDPFQFYLQKPERGSLHHGGESLEISWFLAHKNLSSSELSVELNYTVNNETNNIGNYQGEYKADWQLPEINGNLSLNCRVFDPNGSLVFEEDYGLNVDSVAPKITAIEPTEDSGRIDSQRDNFTVKFSEDIDEKTTNEENVYFRPELEYYYIKNIESDTLEILLATSLNSLEKNTSYSLILRNVTDKAGNPLDKDYAFDFTTAKNKAPNANFTFEPEKADIYQTINFESISEDVDGDIVEYRWDFGGLKKSDEEEPTMIFEEEGIYYVNLTVWDKEGAYSSMNKTLQVEDSIQGEIRVEPETPVSSDEIDFSFEHQEDIDFESLSWNFGDGSESEELNPVHEYDQPGVYEVSIELDLERGYTYICNKSVKVWSPPPEANVNVIKDSFKPNEFRFGLNFSDDENDISNITWNFGDGTVSYGKEVDHEYSNSGIYNVTVEITAENGLTRTYKKTVKVEEDPQPNSRVFYYVLPSVGLMILLLVLFSDDKK